MQNSQHQISENSESQCITPVIITTPIINGIIGGISSVITAYFFKPLWNKITKLWSKNDVC